MTTTGWCVETGGHGRIPTMTPVVVILHKPLGVILLSRVIHWARRTVAPLDHQAARWGLHLHGWHGPKTNVFIKHMVYSPSA